VVNAPSTVSELESRLSEPPAGVVTTLAGLDGDVLVLGVGGKMGPSLAGMAKRAFEAAGLSRKVIGVSRFSSSNLRDSLEHQGVGTIECDLLNETAVAQLPDAPNVVFMAGMKFGSSGRESLTWAMNAYVPAVVCRRYAKSRIVAFSTGNVYGLTAASGGGSVENDSLRPVGEYAMSCVGRERMFEHFSQREGTPVAIVRVNYASELRYGVLLDLAQKIWEGRAIDLAMGYFNTIWLADANAMALQSLEHAASPAAFFNITGRETLRVREVCERFGKLLGKTPVFAGTETNTALLSNPTRAYDTFGRPTISPDQLIDWVAQWVRSGQPVLNKPTHFESRDGRF